MPRSRSESSRSHIGYVYSRWEGFLGIFSKRRNSDDLIRVTSSRREKQLTELHTVAHHLLPTNADTVFGPGEQGVLFDFLRKYLEGPRRMKAMKDFLNFKHKRDNFSSPGLHEDPRSRRRRFLTHSKKPECGQSMSRRDLAQVKTFSPPEPQRPPECEALLPFDHIMSQ